MKGRRSKTQMRLKRIHQYFSVCGFPMHTSVNRLHDVTDLEFAKRKASRAYA